MKLIRTALILGLLSLSPAPLFAKSKASAPSVDPDYIAALGTADRFLHAWQSQDEEAGVLLLSDRIRQRTPEDQVHSFFSSSTDTRSSYEIGRGKKLAAGRYQFPVALLQHSARSGQKWMHPLISALIVARSGKNDWVVDKLP